MTAIADAPLPLAASHEPGVYDGIPLAEYHADKTTLSSSGARKLLPPSCPAKFRYWQDNPEGPKPHFDFGTAAHTLILNDGPEIAVCEFGSWRSKAAEEAQEAARARGAVPVLESQYKELQAMAKAVREHPYAGPLFAPETGKAEQSLYWLHRETGVTLRARPDWLRFDRIVDYKTCISADPESISKDVARYGYHVQEAMYRAGARALGLFDGDPIFTFVFQEKTPPYLITVIELDDIARKIGRSFADMAVFSFAECTASGVWPDYMADSHPRIPQIPLPAWVEREYR